MTISLDDPRWTGGNPRLYVVRSKEVGTFHGATLEAAFTYSYNELTKGTVSRIRGIRPITDAVNGLAVVVDCHARIGDAPRNVSAASLRTSGVMPIRASGRYVRPRLTIAAGTNWSFAQGLEMEFEAGGGR
jgi:hypothetical protein